LPELLAAWMAVRLKPRVRSLLTGGQKLEKAAGVAHVGGHGRHSLRRKFANDAERTGAPLVDIARLGGWRGPETLLRIYMLPDDASMRNVLQNVERLRAGGE
jgi:hypothetical protein